MSASGKFILDAARGGNFGALLSPGSDPQQRG
jgi:hypothetical protein